VAWRWAAASAIGTSHIRSGERLQDAYAVSAIGSNQVFAVVSDGAGSAKFGAYGAWIVCRVLKVHFREWLAQNDVLPDDETLTGWIDDIRERISTLAEQRGTVQRQFAATMAALLILPSEVMAIQVGDSALVGRHGSAWDVICWPENGEYASSTYFVTDYPEPHLKIVRQKGQYDAFALFTDGVGDLALSYLEERAHPRFFNPMIRPLDLSTGAGRLHELSEILGAFLAGPAICERTDDDKTIILLSKA
jgi:hypothetical protein